MKNIIDIFIKFFTLGLFSFGGPMAHIGYFRKTFVEKLNWLDETSYGKLLALSSFLPGPSSSQVGFAIGLKRGGILGAITAFIAFTFPSFILLYILVSIGLSDSQSSFLNSIILGLKLFAVVIVADATISMFKSFYKEKTTYIIFGVATLVLVLFSSTFMQIAVLIMAAFIGNLFLSKKIEAEKIEQKKINKLPLFIFLFLLFIAPFFLGESTQAKLFTSFYEAGSLVFGGGHVVLPLLEHNLANLVDKDNFIVGYSLAQAVPGPMFTIASYLGAIGLESSPFMGALIATLAIFAPGFLLILAFYGSFESYTKKASIMNAISGVNAAVVALLFATLLTTVAPAGINGFFDFILAIIGLMIVRFSGYSILKIILIFIVIGLIKSFLGI